MKTPFLCIAYFFLLLCPIALTKFQRVRGGSYHLLLWATAELLVTGVSPNRSKAISLKIQNFVTGELGLPLKFKLEIPDYSMLF